MTDVIIARWQQACLAFLQLAARDITEAQLAAWFAEQSSLA